MRKYSRNTEDLVQSLESLESIVKTLVNIANSMILMLPEGNAFRGIASELVLALCRCNRKEEYYTCLRDFGGDEEPFGCVTTGYIDEEYSFKKKSNSYSDEFSDECSDESCTEEIEVGQLDPLRYLKGMEKSIRLRGLKKWEQRGSVTQRKNSYQYVRNEFDTFFTCTPRQDILDAVRGLFLRNLVNIHLSRVGYGDFLMLCDYEVSPLDPLLFR
jgi:hypothetical protein